MPHDHHSLRHAAQSFYDHPPRPYHNWTHIEDCIAEFAPARHLAQDAAAVEIAIWFHDCIYDPTRSDNEERSADVAARFLTAAGLSASAIATIRGLVLDTRHAAPPATPDGRLLVDIDLSILGRPPAEFDAYELAVRQEYAHVPDDAFGRGRAAILQRFLDRLHIYATDHFRHRYEESARANLSRSLRLLELSPGP